MSKWGIESLIIKTSYNYVKHPLTISWCVYATAAAECEWGSKSWTFFDCLQNS